ncbi:MAG: c-type cytochrome [Rhodobacter sp.]|nr:c-type cytochrome [Rhodobacter sp.]
MKHLKFSLLAAMVWALPAMAADDFGNAENGAEIFDECSGCHELGQGAENGIGPHLNGIFGRKAAGIDGFTYSESLTRAGNDGLVWDLEKLGYYIENPQIFASGTRMSYDGLEDPQERADLLAFLRIYSDNPQNIPEAAPTAIAAALEVRLPPDILEIQGDSEYGEYLSSECLTCHRADGAAEGIPSITFWPEEDFVIAMHAYKRKLRPHPVMQMMAGRLNNEEIAALAAYFAELEE